MATVLRMPEVAANGTEAALQAWVVAEGASFAAGDTVATVETDKAVVDVEAERAGRLLRTLVPAGVLVEVGAPIAVLVRTDEAVDDVASLLASLGVGGSAASSGQAPERRLVPEPTPPVPPEPETPPGAPEPSSPAVPPPSDVALDAGASPAPGAADDAGATGVGHRGGRVFASPLARRLAAEAGLPVGAITGTGPGGRVRRRDVEAAVHTRAAGSEPAQPAPAPAVWDETRLPPVTSGPERPTTGTGEVAIASAGFTEVPHTRMRRAIASRLLHSTRTTPHFFLRAAVEVDRLLQLRAELNGDVGTRISVNDLVLKAAASAHAQVPDLNVVWTEDALRRYDRVDVAVAVAVDGGLLTPVVRDVAGRSVGDLARTTHDLVDRARSGRLTQAELEGGSLTVTNLGMHGAQEFAAIINPPQSAILAVGAARPEAVVHAGAVAVATLMRVTLSVDHRAVDGAAAARWLAALTDLLEHPVRLLR